LEVKHVPQCPITGDANDSESGQPKLEVNNKNTHSPIKKMYYNTKKQKPDLVAFYDIRPGNGSGLFSEEKTRKGGDK